MTAPTYWQRITERLDAFGLKAWLQRSDVKLHIKPIVEEMERELALLGRGLCADHRPIEVASRDVAIEALAQKVAELERDVHRYRHIRRPENREAVRLVSTYSGDELDARLDADIVESKGGAA
jgi:hypothetical protein